MGVVFVRVLLCYIPCVLAYKLCMSCCWCFMCDLLYNISRGILDLVGLMLLWCCGVVLSCSSLYWLYNFMLFDVLVNVVTCMFV